MRIRDPNEIYLEYSQQMMAWLLFLQSKPKMQVAQLGLGTGSLAKFTLEHCPDVVNTVVELNPAVILAARTMFELPNDHAKLRILQDDALAFVNNKRHQQQFDVLQVDLYDAEAKRPALDSLEFYQACANCLKDDGMLTVNLFSNPEQRQANIARLQACFDAVVWLAEVHQHNLIALAFKKAPEIDFAVLKQRAEQIASNYQLNTTSWLEGLQAWMQLE